jgi:hypothetical protein
MTVYQHTATGEVLSIDGPFVGPDGTKFPAGWLRTLSPAEIAAMGYLPYAPPTEVPAVPQELSFSQFVVGLSEQDWITEAEASVWFAANGLPAAVEAVIAALPETAPDGSKPQLRARARALRPSVIERNDPLLAMLAKKRGATSEQLDDFFRVYAYI